MMYTYIVRHAVDNNNQHIKAVVTLNDMNAYGCIRAGSFWLCNETD